MQIIFLNRFFYPDHSATSQILSDLAFYFAERSDDAIVVITSRQRYDDPAAGLPSEETVRGVRIHRGPRLINGDFLLSFVGFRGFAFHSPVCGFGPRVANETAIS